MDKDFTIGGIYDAFVGVTWARVGSRYSTFSPSAAVERILLSSYTTVDLRLGARNQDGWTLTLFAKNLTDERGLLGSSHELGAGTSGRYNLTLIRPRAIGLSLAKDF